MSCIPFSFVQNSPENCGGVDKCALTVFSNIALLHIVGNYYGVFVISIKHCSLISLPHGIEIGITIVIGASTQRGAQPPQSIWPLQSMLRVSWNTIQFLLQKVMLEGVKLSSKYGPSDHDR